MSEKDRFFAIVPVHEINVLVEAPTVEELENGIEQALLKPEIKHPFYNFREKVRIIKGKEVKTKTPQKS